MNNTFRLQECEGLVWQSHIHRISQSLRESGGFFLFHHRGNSGFKKMLAVASEIFRGDTYFFLPI